MRIREECQSRFDKLMDILGILGIINCFLGGYVEFYSYTILSFESLELEYGKKGFQIIENLCEVTNLKSH